MISRMLLSAFGLTGLLASAPATAVVVDISAGPTGNGCTSCFGGPTVLGSGPGMVVILDNEGVGPNQLTLDAGTYSITNAATSGNYSAWRFDGGSQDWAWNFVIGADNGNNTATVLDVGWVGGPQQTSQGAEAAATGVPTYRFDTMLDPNGSTAGYADTLTLTGRTTLDFFVVDGILSDNIGGVSLDITPVGTTLPPPAVPEPASWAMMLGGFGMIGGALRHRRQATPHRA